MSKKLKYGREIVWIKHKRKRFSKTECEYIFKRDGYKCQMCSKDLKDKPQERVLDHKIPLSQLGSNKLKNIWLLCLQCDEIKKSDILPEILSERINELVYQNKQIMRRK